jgi:hypothetical protein
LERFLLPASEKLGLGMMEPFAQTQFSPEQIDSLKANLRSWDDLLALKMAAQLN